jgi:hypothetical protein
MDTESEQDKWARATRNALASGTAAGVLSGVALSVCSKIEEDSAAGALNGPSQWLWGEEEAHTREATVKHTLTGYLIHHAASIFWAALHERTFLDSRAPKTVAQCCMEAAATGVTAYVVDYHLTPHRLRPGFKKHLGPRSIFVVYAAFAAGLATAAITRKKKIDPNRLAFARRRPSQ